MNGQRDVDCMLLFRHSVHLTLQWLTEILKIVVEARHWVCLDVHVHWISQSYWMLQCAVTLTSDCRQ